ncbi:MAG TPA: MlaD family protein [Verrucomicrobiae bacterium]
MKIHANPLMLGAFILGACALAVASFLAFGSSALFRHVGRFMIYIPDSAEGIRIGTVVNLQGVRAGQVENVHVLYDSGARKPFVAVRCRITENLASGADGQPIRLTEDKVIRQWISDGMFAQVATAGIVGAKFIELGFHPSSTEASPSVLPKQPLPVVPLGPSKMTEMTDNVAGVLAHLRETDFPGAVRQAEDALASARRQIDQLQTNRLTDNFSSAAASVGQFVKSEELHGAVAHIQGAAADLQKLIGNLDARVPELATNLNATLAATSQTAGDLRDFLSLRNQLGEQTRQLMEQFDETARDIQQLTDFLDRHPNALITGRAAAPPPSRK